MPKPTYQKFYRMMATHMLFIIWIQMWDVNERTNDKNEGGKMHFFSEQPPDAEWQNIKQNANNKRTGNNMYQYNNTNN
jgi:hypothetical protein